MEINITQQEQLLDELNKGRKEIKTDNMSMSIGEVINLYKDGDLELNPAYQRLFRWDDTQKSRFIESILLGIPLPAIFVAQKSDGKWSVVDGLQRLSTILQLTGELRGVPILVLKETKKLPSLNGFDWNSLPVDTQRLLKRGKLSMNIILTENSIQAQYELFQRLNTGGLHLEPQEIRNCLIIMEDPEFFKELDELKLYPSFIGSIAITENKQKIEFHMELIIRFLIAKLGLVDFTKYNASIAILSDFIDNETINILSNTEFYSQLEIVIFKRTFDLLNNTLGNQSFKKYNEEKDEFEGPFLASSFEAISSGLALNIDYWEQQNEATLIAKIKNIYREEEYQRYADRGVKAITRIKGLMEFSKKYFSNEARAI